ncbi:acetyl-CoA C-acetyltransferase [Pelobacter seleniigenes]|uniref:acetyl-CoA C-acetyltransferase n=1 Tax=Pelobacter seleniigenes TaxID=407188 RepID=UPI0006919EE0|nr:acetyl-CoA C-acetyltransferase [Pelobacter seleniigenes]
MVAAKQSPTRNYPRPVYVVDGARTPFLKAKGRPGPFSAADLAVNVGRALLARQPFAADQLDEVILGCVIPAADEANIARVVSLRLGCGERVPAWTVQRNCASGMQALATAAERIAAGYSGLILAGGTEAMSQAPVLWRASMVNKLADWQQARNFFQKLKVLGSLRPADLAPVIGLLQGLTDPTTNLSMGQTAENLATRFDISREQMDRFALQSHQRLAAAIDNAALEEIIPLYSTDGRAIENDEGLRRDGDLGKLAKLKPVFDRTYGRVTAGNSAQVTDGAALLLLADAATVERFDLPVLGELLGTAWSGLDPAQMGLGPIYAMDAVLRNHPGPLPPIDLWEINEAFAGQVLACLAALTDEQWQEQELGGPTLIPQISPDRLNVDGGAIAIGHPVGASGARIVLHLLQALRRRNASHGIASLCIGGGQGGAMLVAAGRQDAQPGKGEHK